jgi:phytoene synthase
MNMRQEMIDPVADIVRHSEKAIAKGSKSFAAAARLFSPRTREDAVMLYAWCRHADDVVDGQTLGHDQQSDFRQGQLDRVADLKQLTQDALAGKETTDPAFKALQLVAHRNAIPARHPLELIGGFEMDAEQRTYETIEDTLDYCYHVAGVVGVMMTMIMGARGEPVLDRASDLGIAFQLTNIARDVVEDAEAGRVYLPRQWLREAGIETVNAADRDQWPALHAVALRLLDHAEPYYASALSGVSALPPRSAWAVAAARRVYRDIGQKIRSDGPNAWATRVSTGKARKAWMLALSAGDVAGSRFERAEDGAGRDGLYQRPHPS